MKIVSVVGTRPNFMKEYSLFKAFKDNDIEEVIVHTGQHYDFEMSLLFFQELDIPNPNYIADVIKGDHGKQTGAMLALVEEVLQEEKPDLTIVCGDVNSTVAGALASAKLRIPVAHIEAGLRSVSYYNPEEINRRVADTCSEILFPHIQEAYDSLLGEGYSPENVHLCGDVMKDTLLSIQRDFKIRAERGNYHLLTLHRAENTDDAERLQSIVSALNESEASFVFPVHPRTRACLKHFGLLKELEDNPRIELLPPLGYLDFIKYLAGADKVLTDSGGVRREAYILKKPVILLIDIVWVRSMVEKGYALIVDADKEKILDAIVNFRPPAERPNLFGRGDAAVKIADILVNRYVNR